MSNYRHGVSAHHLAATYYAMMRRCYNPNYSGYENYGGRGISVCDEWKLIKGFISWYDNLPSNKKRNPGESLERYNNSGNYSPKNCYFATRSEQARNTRITMRIKFRGKLLPISCVYEILDCEGMIPVGLTIDAVKTRFRERKWTLKESFFTRPMFNTFVAPDGNHLKFSEFYRSYPQPKAKYTTALARLKRGLDANIACTVSGK
jgi:hypothetical protein